MPTWLRQDRQIDQECSWTPVFPALDSKIRMTAREVPGPQGTPFIPIRTWLEVFDADLAPPRGEAEQLARRRVLTNRTTIQKIRGRRFSAVYFYTEGEHRWAP